MESSQLLLSHFLLVSLLRHRTVLCGMNGPTAVPVKVRQALQPESIHSRRICRPISLHRWFLNRFSHCPGGALLCSCDVAVTCAGSSARFRVCLQPAPLQEPIHDPSLMISCQPRWSVGRCGHAAVTPQLRIAVPISYVARGSIARHTKWMSYVHYVCRSFACACAVQEVLQVAPYGQHQG